ncbi:low affinity potassium transporter [Tulasnella sp. 417]|nr:low affinity potassium transporter [Tulasnella sp. 417]
MPMTEDDDEIYPENARRGPIAWLKDNLNFYRIHLVFFTFVPLIFALIFWGSSNKETYPISFIDSLFIVVSSITVTGLATIDLSPLTPWQQVILFFCMIIGHPVTVSWVIVYVRRSYFRRKFGDVIIHRMRERALKDGLPVPPELEEEVEARAEGHWKYHLTKLFKRGTNKKRSPQSSSSRGTSSPGGTGAGSESDSEEPNKSKKHGEGAKVSAHMIRRMDNAPQLVNPSGWISSGHASSSRDRSNSRSQATGSPLLHLNSTKPATSTTAAPAPASAPAPQPEFVLQPAIDLQSHPTIDTDGGASDNLDRQTLSQISHPPTAASTTGYFPRTTTVEFASPPKMTHHRKGSFLGQNVPPSAMASGVAGTASQQQQQQGSTNLGVESSPTYMRRSQSRPDDRRGASFRTGVDIARTNTMLSSRTRGTMALDPTPVRARDRGFGGFPGPFDMIARIVRKLFPSIEDRITIPRTETLVSNLNATTGGSTGGPAPRAVPYLRFDTVVGRNSVFHDLTQEKLEELGGVEYRALTILMWLVGISADANGRSCLKPQYHVCMPIIVFVIIGPYVSQPRWRSTFDDQTGYVAPPWFALFQSVSAYTNTGTSLCDTSMVPFREAYAMIIPMFVVIIAGNTGFPVFLRFFIWILTKIVPKNSQTNETLHFLLDHPRRCYIYLFPSHQTWFLLTVLVGMVLTDWVSFLVLDIGTPEIMQIPAGTRVVIGLLQAAAVRAAGFAAISLNALAPAVKVLYVTMMYVAVYPVALSVRSTNVYEEQSLGIFETAPKDAEEEFEPELRESRGKLWGRYLAMHARRQLSFDIWWLGLALWLVCIIERGKLVNPDNQGWFNIFSVLFELVSAYGTVGLSLGIPDKNYSFSGALSTLSKLIIIAVMIRGRHRGLPVAIDRAVVLKGYDFPDSYEQNETFPRSDTVDRRGRNGELKGVEYPTTFDEKATLGRQDYQNGTTNGPMASAQLAQHLMARSPDEEPESTKPSVPLPSERPRLDTVHEAPAPSAVQTPVTEDPPFNVKGI